MNDRDLRAALQRDAGLVGDPPADLLDQLVHRRARQRRTRITQAGAVAAVAVLAGGISVGASFLNRPDGSPATRTVPTPPSVSRSAPVGPSAPSTTTSVPPPATGSPADGSWQTYSNPRYGFSVEFPRALAPTSSVDGKGLTYRSANGLTEATGAGSDTTPGVTATSEEERFASDLRRRGDLTYSHVDAASATFTVSGHLEGGSIIVYVHGVVGPHTEYVLSWSYPTAKQATVQPWVVHSVETFRPGPL
jgi:hypothetical protein